MNKLTVKASDLIKTLKNAKAFGDSNVFLSELVKMRDDFDLSKSKIMLSVEIDTDDDFLLNGTSFLEEKFVVNDETLHESFMKFFDSLDVKVIEAKKHKFSDLKDMLKSESFKQRLNEEGALEVGGNCTVKVKLLPLSNLVDFGCMCVDLSA